ncbi:hypothetical protein DL93DRAFT_2054055 [Clavulina sp. PMI_390]|nr:hypothetical protein DL93DRAFT_2054055 [Clavulina sp. PMI_390]
MTPSQVDLARRFGDVIINDITLGRNRYNLPLDIWAVIDHHNRTRTIAFAILDSESTGSHGWALGHLFNILPPLAFRPYFSDHDLALEKALTQHDVWHGLCIHHISGNILLQLRRILLGRFDQFFADFWRVYYALSPAAFEHAWSQLVENYPEACSYLEEQLYPTRDRWRWASVMSRFTAGVRTTGRVEGENRVNRDFGDSSTPIHVLFERLLERINTQDEQAKLRNRQHLRTVHPKGVDLVFEAPLELLRVHMEPYAITQSYAQMERSNYYDAELIPLPSNYAHWLVDNFADDHDILRISTAHLIQLTTDFVGPVQSLYRITLAAANVTSVHFIALVDSGRFVCDCLMKENVGIPCRHYFLLLRKRQGEVVFHLGMYNSRCVPAIQLLMLRNGLMPGSQMAP